MEMEKAFQKALRRTGLWRSLFCLVSGALIGFLLATACKSGTKAPSTNVCNNQCGGKDIRKILEILNPDEEDEELEV